MSHNLNYNQLTGKHAFFSVKERAWHGLGQIVELYPTSTEAIQFAGLDFEVAKLPNRQDLPSGKTLVSDNSFFNFRTDTEQVLGDRIGRDYEVVQNTDAFSFFDAIVGGGDGIQYETAGALGNGERIFITAKLPDYIRVGKNDVCEKYIFLTSTHDGSGSITAAFTPIRIVCNNTLNAALQNMEMEVRIRHTSNARERLLNAHKIMGIAALRSGDFQEMFNHWANVRITDKEVLKLIELAMCPNKETLKALQEERTEGISTAFRNTCDAVFSYAMENETQQLVTTKGTVYGAYNAITGYYQNVKSHKSEEAKIKSILYGGTANQKANRAFDLCNDFSKHGAEIFLFN